MDTREKIVPFDGAAGRLAEGDWTVVAGMFDPLTSAQAKRLAVIDKGMGKLFAVVLEEEGALLSGEARAVLVAALRSVDAVTVAKNGDWKKLAGESGRVRVLEDAAAERLRTAQFVQFVLERQAVGQSDSMEQTR